MHCRVKAGKQPFHEPHLNVINDLQRLEETVNEFLRTDLHQIYTGILEVMNTLVGTMRAAQEAVLQSFGVKMSDMEN